MAQRRLDFRFSDIHVDPNSAVPKHRQVYTALREAILEGQLKADDALPSTRELATQINVSRNTVMTAYEILLAEGFIIGRGGAGTFVAAGAERRLRSVSGSPQSEIITRRPLSQTADLLRIAHRRVPLRSCKPFAPVSAAIDAFPYESWTRIVGRHARSFSADWILGASPLGHGGLRERIAEHLRVMRSCKCDADNVIVLAGAQLGLYLCSMLLMNQDDVVWIEEPGFPGAQLVFRSRTNRVVPVPVDEFGLNIEAGQALGPLPRIIYVTPSHQWPLGTVMPVQRRLDLLKFAAEHDIWIIEDDYDGDLRFDGKTYSALQGLDEANRVIHVGTFSKSMFAGLRLGYAVVPRDVIDAMADAREIVDQYPSTVAQASMAEFFERHLYARHVGEMRKLYSERHQLLRAQIEAKLGEFFKVYPAPAGTFTVAEVTKGIDDSALAEELMRQEIVTIALSDTYLGAPRIRGLLLGHAVARPDQIRSGIEKIAEVLKNWPSRGGPSR